MNLLDPILGESLRKKLLAVLAVLNALLVVLQVAADQLESLPSWPWVATASAALTGAVVALTRLTVIGNRVLPPQE